MPFSLLYLCTGNQCRSPLAAALTQQRLTGRDALVRSAGLLAGGRHVPAEGIRLGMEYGLDLTTHVSRPFDGELALDADLVLTMTNAQAREVVTAYPDVWPRVFTAKSFVRWIGSHGTPEDGVSRGWLDEVAAPRRPHELLGSHAADEIEDPMGRSIRVWRRVATELIDVVERVTQALPSRSGVSAR